MKLMEAKTKKINVVTGCAGFLGSHLTQALCARDEFVVGIDNLSRGMESVENLKEIRHDNFMFFGGDILDRDKLRHTIRDGVQTIFHLGALPSHRLALERPYDYISTDLLGTANILELARHLNPIPLVVFASSNKVYGKQECPWREDKLPQPEGPYAQAKLSAEQLCKMYSDYFNVPSVIVRYHHVAGARSNPELALSIFTEQAIKGKILKVHGKQTANGFESCSANYTHVDDAIRATLLAADNYCGFDIYNVANEKTVTIDSMARWVVDRLGSKSTIDYVPMLPHETLVHASDVSKAKDRLGFRAEKKAEEAYSDYIEWRLHRGN